MHKTKAGYLQCTMRVGGKTYPYRVHRLVAMAYHPNPEDLPDVNHKDGDKENNHKDNVEWCSKSANMIHAYATGLLLQPGKLPEETKAEIRKLYAGGGWSQRTLAKQFNVSKTLISRVLNDLI